MTGRIHSCDRQDTGQGRIFIKGKNSGCTLGGRILELK